MLPAAGLQSAYADEPAARPAAVGGDVALEGFEGDGAASATTAGSVVASPTGVEGILAAEGLVYKKVDGGVALIGFEGDGLEGALAVPERLSDGSADLSVVGVDIAEGQAAEGVTSLTLPQSINNVNTATLAAAFPNLASIEIASSKASSAPVVAGAAVIRAAYSSFGGVLYRNAWVATDGDASQTTLTKELIWAPPATVVARIPVECTSIAPGAFADVKDLKTVVCFGVMEDIPQTQKTGDGTVAPGAFTDEQVQTVNVIVPQTGTVVPDGDHVSASVAVTDDSTMDVKREAWWQSGFASDRITLGEVYGSTTNTLPVTEEGILETAEAEVAYAPETTQNSSSRKAGIEPPESAIPTPVPDDDQIDPSESGLVFTHLADMTLSVSWKGDPTATPSHIDIPAYATINEVTYPVTEIAPEAFKGAVFLTSITIPETVKTIGESAFEGCTNLTDPALPSVLKTAAATTAVGASTPMISSEESEANHPTSSQAEDSDIIPYYSLADLGYTTNLGRKVSFKITVNTGSVGYAGAGLGSLVTASASEDRKELTVTYPIVDQASFVSFACFGYNTQMMPHIYLRQYDAGKQPLSPEVSEWVNLGGSWPSIDGFDSEWEISSTSGGWYTTTRSADEANGQTYTIKVYSVPSSYDEGVFRSLLNKKSDIIWVNANFAKQTSLDSLIDEFGTIGYADDVFSQDDASLSAGASNGGLVLPRSYRATGAAGSGLPTLVAPERDGKKFLRWEGTRTGTKQGGTDITEATSNLSELFRYAGDVYLTAVWEDDVPKANYFYTESDPYKDGSPSSTILVRLAAKQDGETQKSLSSVSFSKKDGAPLGSNADGVTFKVGDAGSVGWGADAGSVALEESGGYWCARVTVTVPSGAIDSSKVASSYVDSSYVASLAKMSYEFA